MKVTAEDIKRVALLSRLRIAEGEMGGYVEQFDGILRYMDVLQELDTATVDPTTYALPIQNVWREDAVKATLPRELALSAAPLQDDGYFKVPRVLEE